MRKTHSWFGRRAMLALGSLAVIGGVAHADATVSTTAGATMAPSTATTAQLDSTTLVYSTSGLVGTTGISGTPVISLKPISDAEVGPTNLSLGSFMVASQPSGSVTTYNNTPFAVSYATSSINGNDILGSQPLLTITGHLNGSIGGTTNSTVTATFDPIANPTINFGTFNNTQYVGSLAITNGVLQGSTYVSGVSIVPANDTIASIQATIISAASPVPEPTTLALFLAAGAGLGLRRRIKAKAGR